MQKPIRRLTKSVVKAIDGGIFNDAFRRAVVHGKDIRKRRGGSLPGHAIEALRRERTLPTSAFLEAPQTARFIGGITGRSGTTWLTRIMRHVLKDSHAIVGEQGLFVLSLLRSAPYEYYQFGGVAAGRRRYLQFFHRNLLHWAYKRRRIYGSGLKGPMRYVPKRAINAAMECLITELEPLQDLTEIQHAFGRFYTALMNYNAAVLYGEGAPWVSKEPPYGRHADDLLAMVPQSRLLILARDGRDIALSMFKRGWSTTIRGSMHRWATFTTMTLDAIDGLPEERVRLFRYSEVVSNFEEQLPAMFFHLKLPEPDVGAILSSGKRKLIPSAASVGAWRREIAKEDLAWFDAEYGSLMERLGYRD